MSERSSPPPLWFLPRGSTLKRRFVLAEVLGPPRALAPWRPMLAADTSRATARER